MTGTAAAVGWPRMATDPPIRGSEASPRRNERRSAMVHPRNQGPRVGLEAPGIGLVFGSVLVGLLGVVLLLDVEAVLVIVGTTPNEATAGGL